MEGGRHWVTPGFRRLEGGLLTLEPLYARQVVKSVENGGES